MFFNYPSEYYVDVIAVDDLDLVNKDLRSLEYSFRVEKEVDEEYADEITYKEEISEDNEYTEEKLDVDEETIKD
ncbi:MAG: hypothetical protein GX275_10955 [Clostridiales bacterium]|nr:hypothetical protein [Clostridiales bacterium]